MQLMKISLPYFFALVSSLMLLGGCRPEPDTAQLVDQLVVSTNYDNEVDFSAFNTFAIPTDTLGFVSNSSPDTILVASQSTYPRPVLTAINGELTMRGYARVAKNESPDLGVNVLVANDFNVFQSVVYPSYYGNYGNYYSGYYGYGGYYSYPYVNTYVKNTGVLIIELVDLKNRTPDNKVRVVWSAYLGDVYSTLDLQQETAEGIHQAFIQSPYLGK